MTDNVALESLIPKLAKRKILVVGDVILDEYLTGNATRISREAPVPVLEFESSNLIPGGAANPAANIVTLGSYATQIGIVGEDDSAEKLRQILEGRGIDIGGLISDSARPTTVKTRIMAQMGLRFPQQVARLDRLSRLPVDMQTEQRIGEYVMAHIQAADAVLLSDYHNGLLTSSLVETIRAGAKETILAADAQGELTKYTGFTIVKCNADEARAHLRRDLYTDRDFAVAAEELCRSLDLSGVMVITRGASGATLATAAGDIDHLPAPAVSDVYDTVGAGDTTIAVLTLAVVAGASYRQATVLSNYASSLVVRRVGNYTPSQSELLLAIDTWG
jgi:D-glycero-beta-D-manno-heptose-7-phosphate kinase